MDNSPGFNDLDAAGLELSKSVSNNHCRMDNDSQWEEIRICPRQGEKREGQQASLLDCEWWAFGSDGASGQL